MTGNSGIGKVAEGAVFANGVVVVAWLPKDDLPGATNIYHSIEEVEKLHGHQGKTVVVYVSPE